MAWPEPMLAKTYVIVIRVVHDEAKEDNYVP